MSSYPQTDIQFRNAALAYNAEFLDECETEIVTGTPEIQVLVEDLPGKANRATVTFGIRSGDRFIYCADPYAITFGPSKYRRASFTENALKLVKPRLNVAYGIPVIARSV